MASSVPVDVKPLRKADTGDYDSDLNNDDSETKQKQKICIISPIIWNISINIHWRDDTNRGEGSLGVTHRSISNRMRGRFRLGQHNTLTRCLEVTRMFP